MISEGKEGVFKWMLPGQCLMPRLFGNSRLYLGLIASIEAEAM